MIIIIPIILPAPPRSLFLSFFTLYSPTAAFDKLSTAALIPPR
jgi:hypothetical protein